MSLAQPTSQTIAPKVDLPRLGFLGVGWIGRNRLEAIARSGTAVIAAAADPAAENAAAVQAISPDVELVESLDDLLAADLDGIVIATPSALHADQSVAALERGLAVFCQKPLGRSADETRRVVDAARAADRLLGVDLSYRFTAAMQAIYPLIRNGDLGEMYAVNLVFHNAYGPDKAWFYDPKLSGGGCVIDLGIHLIDLALWTLDYPGVVGATSDLFNKGERLRGRQDVVENYAVSSLQLATGVSVQLACSWHLPAGVDCVIEAAFYGTNGGAALRNLNGSFYDFTAERFNGTARETLALPPDEWGGRAAVDWARRLAAGERFDPNSDHLVDVAAALDAIYAGAR